VLVITIVTLAVITAVFDFVVVTALVTAVVAVVVTAVGFGFGLVLVLVLVFGFGFGSGSGSGSAFACPLLNPADASRLSMGRRGGDRRGRRAHPFRGSDRYAALIEAAFGPGTCKLVYNNEI
jgi:hypothetical protein